MKEKSVSSSFNDTNRIRIFDDEKKTKSSFKNRSKQDYVKRVFF